MSEESGLWSLRLGDFGLAVQLQPGEELRGIEAGRMAMEDLKRLIESGGPLQIQAQCSDNQCDYVVSIFGFSGWQGKSMSCRLGFAHCAITWQEATSDRVASLDDSALGSLYSAPELGKRYGY